MDASIPAMLRAIELSRAVLGTTSPNPPVGAVVLDQHGEPVGEGATAPPGGPHAEVVALRQAGVRAFGGTVVCTPEQAEPMCAELVKAFDDAVPGFYDPDDVVRGFLEVTDRRGELRQHPLVSVSVGVALYTGGDRDHRAVIAAASEMKGVAKTQAGSVVAVDRRA